MQVTASGCYAFLKSYSVSGEFGSGEFELTTLYSPFTTRILLQKGGIPATPSGTATLLRLHPPHRALLRRLRPLRVRPATSGATDSSDVTGGECKARERIHRCVLTSGY